MPDPSRDAEMVDSSVSKTDGLNVREGSTPSLGTLEPTATVDSPREKWYQQIPFFKDKLQATLFSMGIFFFVLAFVLYVAEATGRVPLLTAIKTEVSLVAGGTPAPSGLPEFTPSPFPITSPIPGSTYQPALTVLNKVDGEQRTEVLRFEHGLNVAQWQNLLFYVGKSTQNPPAADGTYTGVSTDILSYNFETGETKVIGNTKAFEGISDIEVIGDKLFVAEAGYFTKEGLLMMNLPPTGTFTQIAEVENVEIVKENNQYWLRGGQGDGCGGYRTFSVLNPDNNSVISVFQSNEGCMEGERLIDRDKDGNFVITDQMNVENPTVEPWGISTVFKTVSILYYPSLEKRQIFGGDQLPQNVVYIGYLDQQNQLLLFSKDTVWIADISTQQISEVATGKSFVNVEGAAGVQKNAQTYCLKTYGAEINLTEINLETGAETSASDECIAALSQKENRRYRSTNTRNIETINSVVLPPGYEFVYTPHSD